MRFREEPRGGFREGVGSIEWGCPDGHASWRFAIRPGIAIEERAVEWRFLNPHLLKPMRGAHESL
jgi:hypothetical protein